MRPTLRPHRALTTTNLYSRFYWSYGGGYDYFLPPKMALMIAPPILRSIPALVVGMPVWRVKLRLACVMPKALFHENERPGIPVFDLRDMIF